RTVPCATTRATSASSSTVGSTSRSASSPTKKLGGPDLAPQTPQRSEHPGEAVALLDTPTGSWLGGGPDGPFPSPPFGEARAKARAQTADSARRVPENPERHCNR